MKGGFSGLFLIDSEANISGALERMRSESATMRIEGIAND